MSVIIKSGDSADLAVVTSDGELAVRTSRDPELVGFTGLATINDLGSLTGTVEAQNVHASRSHRMLVGIDTPIYNDSFNYVAQNTSNYLGAATTQTLAFGGGYATLNNSAIVTASTNSAIQTRRFFPIFGGFELRAETSILFTSAPQVNAATEWGLFTAVLPGGASPTDGVFFRFTTAGLFRAVLSFGGVETNSADLAIPSNSVNHRYKITIDQEHVDFWVDDVIVAHFDTPTGQGQPIQSPSLPFTIRHYIGGTPPATAMQVRISTITVNFGEMNIARLWPHTMAGNGLVAYQGQNGHTQGSTANYANSANPSPAVPTNTTAALGVGLGGQFWETASIAVNTDGVICSYQNPVPTTAIPGRTLYVTGVKVLSYIQTIIAGGPLIAQWSVAFGHTTVSLGTSEAATTKAPRRIPIGVQVVTLNQAASTLVDGEVTMKFDSPIPVLPGEFFALVKKHVGTVGTSGTIAHIVTVDGYWE